MRQMQSWNDQCTGSASVGYTAGFRCGCSVAQVGGRSFGLKAAHQERSREPLLRCLSRAEAVSDFPRKFLSDLEQPAAHPEGKRVGTVSSRLQGIELQLCPRPQPFSCCSGFEKYVFSGGNPTLRCLSCLMTAVSLNLTWTALCISQAPSCLINSLIPTLQQIPEGSSQFKTHYELPPHPYPNPHPISQASADPP